MIQLDKTISLENTNCTEYHAKVKPKPISSNVTTQERKALHNLRKDCNNVLLLFMLIPVLECINYN